MKKLVKQILGIDVGQKELVVCLGRMTEDWAPELYASKAFPNSLKGFNAMEVWVKKLVDPDVPLRFVMEATGVYHESLAYYLCDQQYAVSIVLPNKVSNYFRTLKVKTINDQTASQAIALFGLERKLEDWKRPNPVYKRLRQLVRERDQLIQERTIVKNQLHAEKSEAEPGGTSLLRMKKRITLLDKQEVEIKEEIQRIVKKDPKTNETVQLISTIPGIGTLTAVTILAETNGFELIRNKRQLTSYAGLDVVEKQSGTSVKGKPRISKKGNKYLRKAMYFPALSVMRYDERFKALFARLVSKNGIKMKAGVAVQRKLLEMTYTIFKTHRPYDKNYLNKAEAV
ncbi:MAG: IS110 family transposase [Ferruginibacter sp.]|nr:IS110 family transposase [Ferruginibacter sp.]